MKILGIDPGSKESGFVDWDSNGSLIASADKIPNVLMLIACRLYSGVVAIEQIRGYGIVAGDDTFDTCEWTGRFREAHEGKGGKVMMIPRKDIKHHLCGNTTCKDTHVRQALIDKYGPIGTKKEKGPLYGISGHCWSALAVCVTCQMLLELKDI